MSSWSGESPCPACAGSGTLHFPATLEEAGGRFQTGELVVDFDAKRVTLSGQELTLSRLEYRLLCTLARGAGRFLSPDQLLERVWGEEYEGEVHLLRITMSRLRGKLGETRASHGYISTRPGIGYSLVV